MGLSPDVEMSMVVVAAAAAAAAYIGCQGSAVPLL